MELLRPPIFAQMHIQGAEERGVRRTNPAIVVMAVVVQEFETISESSCVNREPQFWHLQQRCHRSEQCSPIIRRVAIWILHIIQLLIGDL